MLERLTKPIGRALSAVVGTSTSTLEEQREAAFREKFPPFEPQKTRVFTSNGLPPGEEVPPPGPIKLPMLTPNASAELAEAETQLAFLVNEFNEARAALQKFPRSSFTPMPDQATRRKQYREALAEGQSLHREPSTDLPLLVDALHRPQYGISSGLIEDATTKVNALKAPPPASPSEEYRRLTAAEDKAFLAWGKARKARRAYEAAHTVGQARHEYKLPRAAFGVNFAHVDCNTIQRVAEMACSMSDGK